MRLAVLVLMCLPGFVLAAGDCSECADEVRLQRFAQEVLDAQGFDPRGPGITLLVARGEKLLVSEARGMASIELDVPLRPDHVLRIGSITKQMAAATLLSLVDEGKASLKDPLSRHLPDYPNGSNITLEQLLQHTSGIKDFTALPGYMDEPLRRDLGTDALISVFKDEPPDFAPGSRFAYNNSGYVLVGAVIESIAKQPWHKVLEQRLLVPRGIRIGYPHEALIPGHVSGYTDGHQGVVPARFMSMSQAHASGSLVGNVEALWRWNQALHGGGFLKSETYQRMITPSGPAAAGRYGYGIAVGRLRGQPYLHHNGSIHGYFSSLHYLPAQRLTVALLRNHDGGKPNLDALGRRIAAFAIGKAYPDPKTVPVEPAALTAFVGSYSNGSTERSVVLRDGRLWSQRGQGTGLALAPVGKDRFALAGSVTQLQFERSPDGVVQRLRLLTEGDELGDMEIWDRLPSPSSK